MVSAKDMNLQGRSPTASPHSARDNGLKAEGQVREALVVELEPDEVIFDEEDTTDSDEEIILQARRLSLNQPPGLTFSRPGCAVGDEISRNHRARLEHAATTPAGAPVDHLSSSAYSQAGGGGGIGGVCHQQQQPIKRPCSTEAIRRTDSPTNNDNNTVAQAIFRSQFLTDFTQRVLPPPFEKVPVQLVNQYTQEVARTVSNPQDPRARMLVKMHPNVVLYSQQCQLFDNHWEDIEDRARRVARRTTQWVRLNQSGDPELAYQWLRGMDNSSSEQNRHKVAQRGSLQLRKCAVYKQASQVLQHSKASSL